MESRDVNSGGRLTDRRGKRYIQRPVGRAELRSLLDLADAEERAFFERNPHLVRPYRRRLLVVALCQGAALQYVSDGYGVNDFDVHYFYDQDPAKPRLSRAVRRIFTTVGTFNNVPEDFIRTVVPATHTDRNGSLAARIEAFLRKRPTANSMHIAQKAVVGLDPKTLFGRVLWQPSPLPASRTPVSRDIRF